MNPFKLKDLVIMECKRCLEEKPRENFPKNKDRQGGHETICSTCQNLEAQSNEDREISVLRVKKQRYERRKQAKELYGEIREVWNE